MGNVKANKQIQFRLSAVLDLALQNEAARRGMSVNELAKKMVVNELTNVGTSTFKADVHLRHSVVTSFNLIQLAVFIIMNANPEFNEEKATSIANEFIFSKGKAQANKLLKQLGVED